MSATGNAPDDISVVLPTYNRAAALSRTLPTILALDGITEVIVVIDGSDDGTADEVGRHVDPRLRTVAHDERRGSPAARNTGVRYSTGRWVLFAEDDCTFPRDYATLLRDVARSYPADIVGAPWVQAAPGKEHQVLLKARARPVGRLDLDSHPSSFPTMTIPTPFLPATALVRRQVFDRLRFDEAFKGNAYREETSFFVSAVEAGFTSVITPSTASVQTHRWSGGQSMPRLSYEYWVLRNNWRFLRHHHDWLRSHGYISSTAAAHCRFTYRRWAQLLAAASRARHLLP